MYPLLAQPSIDRAAPSVNGFRVAGLIVMDQVALFLVASNVRVHLGTGKTELYAWLL